jgi:MarR family transcriptional regulator, organic hydroperoxide resistance regulator
MKNSQSDLDQDVNVFWTLLFQIVTDSEKRLAAHLNARNLTPPQLYVLKTLVEHGGRCLIGEIAREHHLTNATMTGLIKRLEAMEPPLVLREQSTSDRRSVYVVLTPAGQERFLAVQVDLLEQVRAIFQLLTSEERQDLIHYLSRYVNVVAELFPVGEIQP